MTSSLISIGVRMSCLLVALLLATPEDQQQEISAVLDGHQRALAAADAEAFFANFANDAIIMGTAPTDRFGLDEFRDRSAPIFAQGPRPVATLLEENITLGDGGKFAWFDQRIHRAVLGELRLSGVLRKEKDRWEIVQLNHAFPVPDEIAVALVEEIRRVSPYEANDPRNDAPAAGERKSDAVQAVTSVLTRFFDAASDADLEEFFEHLADDAIALGTATGERWTMSAYRPVVGSFFAQGRGWNLTPIDRNIYLTEDGRHAWFDNRVIREGIFQIRGTGVLRREHDAWKIVHLNTTLMIPDEVVGEFTRLRNGTLTPDALARRLLGDGESPVTPDPKAIDLGPAAWPENDFENLIERSRAWGRPQPAASGKAGMVAGTTQPLAVRAGVEALRMGGTAMDAACVTALTQVSLNLGATVSYAGILAMVYYEAESGEVHALMAPFATPLAEDSPLTIPVPGTASGRTALVPGFMKGIEAGHRRFGSLPFSSMFGPAIFFAERGVPVEGPLESWIRGKQEVLSRLPATRAIFTNSKGECAPHGELLMQPAVAATLRRVAAEGAAHMYTGDWARDFVRAVRTEGGKISAEDLARYDVVWSKPLRSTYRTREICTVAAPLIGGRMLLESMNLLELADPARRGHYRESAESCYWLIQCTRMARIMRDIPEPGLKMFMPEASFGPEDRLSKENIRRIWEQMQKPDFMRLIQGKLPKSDGDRKKSGGHSDAVVAIDAAGNIAAVCHTINTVTWGTTGLFVNGVSIPDSAAFQQLRMVTAGPGAHMPNEMNPAIVLASGKPILAGSAIGVGLHEATVSCLHNILDFGMSPHEALATPMLMTPYHVEGARHRSQFFKQGMQAGLYPDELLSGVQDLGQEVIELDATQATRFRGYWIGIAIDPATAERSGAVDSNLNGAALAED